MLMLSKCIFIDINNLRKENFVIVFSFFLKVNSFIDYQISLNFCLE